MTGEAAKDVGVFEFFFERRRILIRKVVPRDQSTAMIPLRMPSVTASTRLVTSSFW